ncbi:carbohydrate kinase family protein [Lewinella cohaerens]|uniref:carbohydrate kinase family protein n=1 Tax=Lewinella cohaerens TaxID=70995 RepID=UPI000376D2B3|nr:carbohydrate kinase [Lewinella cohaerens]
MSQTNFPSVLAVGELLIDLISSSYASSFDDVTSFERIVGGSPANMASNLSRLGQHAALVASIGKDDMGDYLQKFVNNLSLDTSGVHQVPYPTTLVLVTKSQQVSNFEAYRLADCQISKEQLPDNLLEAVKVFHTTCFALSKEPARTTILNAASKVAAAGGQLSIDANYAAKIWPDQAEAQEIVATYCSHGAMVKFSDVDWERLYGYPVDEPASAASFLHGLGAKTVCITLGEKGCFVSSEESQHFVPSRPIEVVDTTGAGDAFWSGFLCAYIDGYNLYQCALAGRRMAEIKLQHFGPLPGKVDKRILYLDFQQE